MKLSKGMVLVLPDVEDLELSKSSDLMVLESDQYDFKTGIVVDFASDLDNRVDFPYERGDWVHYRPVGGWKVQLGRDRGSILSKNSPTHLVMLSEQILLSE